MVLKTSGQEDGDWPRKRKVLLFTNPVPWWGAASVMARITRSPAAWPVLAPALMVSSFIKDRATRPPMLWPMMTMSLSNGVSPSPYGSQDVRK